MTNLWGIAAVGLVLTACGAAAPGGQAARAVAGGWAVREPAVGVAPAKAVPSKAAPSKAVPATAAPAKPTRAVARVSRPFATPEAAMRQLARAYNAGSLAALKQVTTPDAREHLLAMRPTAPDLRLESCERRGRAYSCTFSHAYPTGTGRGQAWLDVDASAGIGYYATTFEGCG